MNWIIDSPTTIPYNPILSGYRTSSCSIGGYWSRNMRLMKSVDIFRSKVWHHRLLDDDQMRPMTLIDELYRWFLIDNQFWCKCDQWLLTTIDFLPLHLINQVASVLLGLGTSCANRKNRYVDIWCLTTQRQLIKICDNRAGRHHSSMMQPRPWSLSLPSVFSYQYSLLCKHLGFRALVSIWFHNGQQIAITVTVEQEVAWVKGCDLIDQVEGGF